MNRFNISIFYFLFLFFLFILSGFSKSQVDLNFNLNDNFKVDLIGVRIYIGDLNFSKIIFVRGFVFSEEDIVYFFEKNESDFLVFNDSVFFPIYFSDFIINKSGPFVFNNLFIGYSSLNSNLNNSILISSIDGNFNTSYISYELIEYNYSSLKNDLEFREEYFLDRLDVLFPIYSFDFNLLNLNSSNSSTNTSSNSSNKSGDSFDSSDLDGLGSSSGSGGGSSSKLMSFKVDLLEDLEGSKSFKNFSYINDSLYEEKNLSFGLDFLSGESNVPNKNSSVLLGERKVYDLEYVQNFFRINLEGLDNIFSNIFNILKFFIFLF